MKRKVFVLSLLFVFIIPMSNLFAFEVISQYGEAIEGDGVFYNSSIDSYFLDLKDGSVNKAHFTRYKDSTFSTIDTEMDQLSEDAGGVYFESWTFHCNRAYDVKFYDYAGFQVGHIRFVASEIKNPTCEVITPPDDSNGNDSGDDCSSVICECLRQIRTVNEVISSRIGIVSTKLDDVISSNLQANTKIDEVKTAVNNVSDSIEGLKPNLDGIKGSIEDFHNEFDTDANYNIDSTLPRVDKGESAVVDQPTQAHDDTNIYFKDEGDALEPIGKLPLAPDIKDWDGVTQQQPLAPEQEQIKESEQVQQPEQTKENELEKAPDLKVDEFNQDKEMLPDILQPDQQLNLDSPMNIQPFEKSPDLKVDEFEIDTSMDFTDKYNQTEFYNKDPSMSISE